MWTNAFAVEQIMSEDEPTEGTPVTDALGTVYDTDRDRAMLTRGDREVLLDEREYDSAQQQYSALFRVRKHIENSLLDAHLIALECPQEELEKIQQRRFDREEPHELGMPLGLYDGLEKPLLHLAFRFAYSNFENTTHRSADDAEDFEEFFENIIGGAISHGLSSADESTAITELDIDITINRERFNQEEFLNQLVHAEQVTERRLIKYLSKGDVELLREELREHNEKIKFTGEVLLGQNREIGPSDPILQGYESED